MPILNYTTSIDAEKSAMEISKCLAAHGASAIMQEYDPSNGRMIALSFQIEVDGQRFGFKLPCDYRPILSILNESKRVPSRLKTNDQASRVTWRIVKDWVEAQMALVETNMVSTREVFLPYMVLKGGKTLAQAVQTDPKFLLQ